MWADTVSLTLARSAFGELSGGLRSSVAADLAQDYTQYQMAIKCYKPVLMLSRTSDCMVKMVSKMADRNPGVTIPDIFFFCCSISPKFLDGYRGCC